ncbi:hypothetical protein OYV_08900, partial ['Chrysanthemum coronarium' phytoplasma]
QFNPTFVEPKSDQNPNEDNPKNKDNTIDEINELN